MSEGDHLNHIINGSNVQNRSRKFLENISELEEKILEILYQESNTLTLEEVAEKAKEKDGIEDYIKKEEILPVLEEFSDRDVIAVRKPNHANKQHYSINPQNENVLSNLSKLKSSEKIDGSGRGKSRKINEI